MSKLHHFAFSGLLLSSALIGAGCAQEVSHTESDKPNLLDEGHTKKESTTYKNPDGTMHTETTKTRTSE